MKAKVSIASLCAVLWLICVSFSAASAQESEVEDEESPRSLVLIDGIPALAVSVLDNVSDADARRAPLRERLLREGFSMAIKESGLRYAYNLAFHPIKREDGVPLLELEIRDWAYDNTRTFECTVYGVYYDETGKRTDLKGTVGFQSTLSMSPTPQDMEDHMQAAARKAIVSMLGRIKKNRLYPVY